LERLHISNSLEYIQNLKNKNLLFLYENPKKSLNDLNQETKELTDDQKRHLKLKIVGRELIDKYSDENYHKKINPKDTLVTTSGIYYFLNFQF